MGNMIVHLIFNCLLASITRAADLELDIRDVKFLDKIPSVVDFSRGLTIIDTDGSKFDLMRLKSYESLQSCYSMIKNSTTTVFCYPGVNIIGFPKCGTSSVYDFFTRQKAFRSIPNVGKEYCWIPSHNKVLPLYDYFTKMADLRDHEHHQQEIDLRITVNGCINPWMNAFMHRLLQPRSAYILVLRELSKMLWASYNFWCEQEWDAPQCKGTTWSSEGMYRSGGMFYEILLAANYPSSRGFQRSRFSHSCSTLNSFYSHIVNEPLKILNTTYILSIEALSLASSNPSDEESAAYVHDLVAHVNHALRLNLRLNISLLHKANDGNSRFGMDTGIDTKPGHYKVSRYDSLSSYADQYIRSCWQECSLISNLTRFSYNCSSELYTTGGSLETGFLQKL